MKYCITLLSMLAFLLVTGQKELPLYDAVPNSKAKENFEKSDTDTHGIVRIRNVTVPTLTVYQPQRPIGTAIIICPGGGYGLLAASHEGSEVATTLQSWGVTAFVLKYRLPDDKTMFDKSIAPLQDAQRAIQMVRQNAKTWRVDPKKIGIMGFSAGGHLAATLSTRYEDAVLLNPKKTSLRPDFSILIYPVISMMDSVGHIGSRTNLLGKRASESRIRKYSNELNVTKKTPPAFLVHAKDDKTVPYQNSILYQQALQKNNIAVTVKTFERGGHGFGMNNTTTEEKWMDDLQNWMKQQKLL